MHLAEELTKFGLSKPEIRIYLYLLEQGLSTPPKIIRGTKILRANAYLILKSLEEKGLIDTQPKGKRKLYFAKDPETLMLNLEKRKDSLSEMLPDLRALYKSQKNKPTIKFLYGLDEIKDYLQPPGVKKKFNSSYQPISYLKLTLKHSLNIEKKPWEEKSLFKIS